MRDPRTNLAKLSRHRRRAMLAALIISCSPAFADGPVRESAGLLPPLPLASTSDGRSVHSNPFCDVSERPRPTTEVKLASGNATSTVRLKPIGAAIGLHSIDSKDADEKSAPVMTIEPIGPPVIRNNPLVESTHHDNQELVDANVEDRSATQATNSVSEYPNWRDPEPRESSIVLLPPAPKPAHAASAVKLPPTNPTEESATVNQFAAEYGSAKLDESVAFNEFAKANDSAPAAQSDATAKGESTDQSDPSLQCQTELQCELIRQGELILQGELNPQCETENEPLLADTTIEMSDDASATNDFGASALAANGVPAEPMTAGQPVGPVATPPMSPPQLAQPMDRQPHSVVPAMPQHQPTMQADVDSERLATQPSVSSPAADAPQVAESIAPRPVASVPQIASVQPEPSQPALPQVAAQQVMPPQVMAPEVSTGEVMTGEVMTGESLIPAVQATPADETVAAAPAQSATDVEIEPTKTATPEPVFFSLSDRIDDEAESVSEDGGNRSTTTMMAEADTDSDGSAVTAGVRPGEIDLVEPLALDDSDGSLEPIDSVINQDGDRPIAIYRRAPAVIPADSPEATLHKKRYRPPVAVKSVPIAFERADEKNDSGIAARVESVRALDLGDKTHVAKAKDTPLYLSKAQVRSLTLGGELRGVKVANKSVCEVFASGPNQLKLIGTGTGVTRLVVWADTKSDGKPTLMRSFEVHVREVAASSGEKIGNKTFLLNQSIRKAFPSSRVNVARSGDQLVVRGRCDSEDAAKKIIRMVRKSCLVPVQDELVVR